MQSDEPIEISPESWKEASIHSIKLAQTIIERSNRGIDGSRRTDPLPLLRDACVKASNERIHTHVRATRVVVMKLRKSLLATNEEIKSLNRGKEALEKALEHKRKDLELNHQSEGVRSCRPPREKETDVADRLLTAERYHFLSLKRSLESQLRKVQQQLQVLNIARARLAAVIQERSRVTDLLCHSMSSTVHTTGLTTSRPGSLSFHRKTKVHSKSYSAPAPLTSFRDGAGSSAFSAGPYESLSPEALQAMMLASEAVSKSRVIRDELYTAISHTWQMQKAAHASVNEGLTRKLAQTVTLTQHLQVNAGETSVTLHRGQRYYDAQEKAQGYLLGPVSSSDLTTRERLDRPLVQVYQRHPGTDLPEAGHLIQACGTYSDSMEATWRNITLLKLAHKRLKEDVKDKKTAAEIDSSIVRLRRRKANHKWVLDGATNCATVKLSK